MKKYNHIQLIIVTLVKPALSCLFIFCFFFGAKAQNTMLMRLVANGNQMQNETLIYFDSLATFGYDPLYDAPSMGVDPGALNIVTSLDSIDYQIDALPSLTHNIAVPVKIMTGTSGLYSVYANDLHNLPEGAWIILHDNYYNANFDLRTGSAQYFISDTEMVARFELRISINIIHNVTGSIANPTCSNSGNGFIYAAASGAGPFNYYWKDSANTIVHASLSKTTADTLYNVNAGNYRVDVTTPGTYSNATVNFRLDGTQSAKAQFTPSSSQVNISNGIATVHFTNTSQNAQFYTWDFGDGTGSSLANPSHSYNQVGTYTITLTCSNTMCPDVSTYRTRITVKATTGNAAVAQQDLKFGVDGNGCFVSLEATEGHVIISVSDLLGRKLIPDIAVDGQGKIYLNESLPSHQVLIIQMSTAGKNISGKFIK